MRVMGFSLIQILLVLLIAWFVYVHFIRKVPVKPQ